MKAILGRKVGMTQLYIEGKAIPVTVIQAGPCYITQMKTEQKDGYNAVQLGYKNVKKASKPISSHFKKADLNPMRYLREFRVDSLEGYEIGQSIDVGIFEEGDVIDVVGWSKGKGFQGVVKRYGFGGGRKTHGSKFHNTIGSTGASTYMSKVIKGKRMPGRMGNKRVTIQNLQVIKVDKKSALLAIKGAVPGYRGRFVMIKEAKKGGRKNA